MRSARPVLLGLVAACTTTHPANDAGPPPDGACLLAPGILAAEGLGSTALAGCRCPAGTSDIGPALYEPAVAADLEIALVCGDAPRATESISNDGCADGRTYYRDPTSAEELGVDFRSFCLPPEVCLFAEGLLPAELHGGCTYADFTAASTGVLPPVDAATCARVLPEGLCGIECPCSNPDDRCYGLSEEHPLGVCVPDLGGTCELEAPLDGSGLDCAPEERCMIAASRPTWFETADWAVRGAAEGRSPFWGRCVPIASCEAIQTELAGVWECLAQ